MAELGLRLALPIVVGVVGGAWLDGALGTTPWLVLAGSLLGISVAFYELVGVATTFGDR
jgi:F0F1-type ATP synthase assembly protein I